MRILTIEEDCGEVCDMADQKQQQTDRPIDHPMDRPTDRPDETVSEWLARRESLLLGPYAARAENSRGRQRPQHTSALRTEYQRDRDRIIHCQSFRRLMNKTQVFLAPVGDHYRTRLTHTLEVSQIARTMARALRLNEDLSPFSFSLTIVSSGDAITFNGSLIATPMVFEPKSSPIIRINLLLFPGICFDIFF